MKLTKIIKSNKPIIGMIHFPPLIGYKGYPGLESIKEKTLKEVELLNNAGVHSIMIENNYDIPHKAFVEPEVTAMLALLADLVVKNTSLPVGIDVLWNDYKSALGICAATGIQYFRVPAFVDDVCTVYGDMMQVADDVIAYRKRLGLENSIAIIADVQVKHSEMLDTTKSLSLSVQQAVKAGADGIIITGKWTGDSPKMDDLRIAKENSGDVPVIVGSGSTIENMQNLFSYADSIIVGTAIMDSGTVIKEKLAAYMKKYMEIL